MPSPLPIFAEPAAELPPPHTLALSSQCIPAFWDRVKGCGLIFYAFDLLHLDGKDLREKPLLERRAKLKRLIQNPDSRIQFSAAAYCAMQ